MTSRVAFRYFPYSKDLFYTVTKKGNLLAHIGSNELDMIVEPKELTDTLLFLYPNTGVHELIKKYPELEFELKKRKTKQHVILDPPKRPFSRKSTEKIKEILGPDNLLFSYHERYGIGYYFRESDGQIIMQNKKINSFTLAQNISFLLKNNFSIKTDDIDPNVFLSELKKLFPHADWDEFEYYQSYISHCNTHCTDKCKNLSESTVIGKECYNTCNDTCKKHYKNLQEKQEWQELRQEKINKKTLVGGKRKSSRKRKASRKRKSRHW